MRSRWLVLLWTLAALFLWWWAGHNPLPDGFQNEYLHVGNAYDLWAAATDLDQLQVRRLFYGGFDYWAPGFYVVPWPLMALIGTGRAALLASNLVHLAVLLWGANALGRSLGGRLAPVLVLLCPATYGSLVRFEPNLAALAWVTAGVALLVDSQGLRSRRHVIGWGVCLGIGLMMDRLSAAFFLVPAVGPLLWGIDRRRLGNLALGGVAALSLTVAYYREFFLRSSQELLSQAPVGEIDAAGVITVASSLFPGSYYLLSLVDSQAGLVLGLLMLWGLGAAVAGLLSRRAASWRAQGVAVAAVVPAFLFFTIVAKKQVFYTLPALGVLAALAATRRGAWIGIIGGLWGFSTLGLGLATGGGPWMPEAWVWPRHTLARPPSMQAWPLAEATDAMGPEPEAISVFSEDQTLFEGFALLAVREAWPDAHARSVTNDPTGTYEFFAQTDTVLWIGPRGMGWPSKADIEGEMIADHLDLTQYPPVADVVASAAPEFSLVGRWSTEDVDLVVYRRRPPSDP